MVAMPHGAKPYPTVAGICYSFINPTISLASSDNMICLEQRSSK